MLEDLLTLVNGEELVDIEHQHPPTPFRQAPPVLRATSTTTLTAEGRNRSSTVGKATTLDLDLTVTTPGQTWLTLHTATSAEARCTRHRTVRTEGVRAETARAQRVHTSLSRIHSDDEVVVAFLTRFP